MEITVKIIWDKPEDKIWLNPDNISLALHSYCQNTKFEVKETAYSFFINFLKIFRTKKNTSSEILRKTERILDRPAAHHLIDIFKELKFGRPAASQQYLQKCIEELEN